MGRPAVAWRSAFACGWVIKVTSKMQNNVPPLGLDLDKKKMTMRRRRVVAGVFSFTITEKVFLSVWFMVFFFFFFVKFRGSHVSSFWESYSGVIFALL